MMEKPEPDILQESHSHSEPLHEVPVGEIVLATLVSIDRGGQAAVTYQLDKVYSNIPALSTVPLMSQMVGSQVGLLFTSQGSNTPVIIGPIHHPTQSILDNIQIAFVNNDDEEVFEEDRSSERSSEPLSKEDVLVDGKRVVIDGKDEVVLRCGEASITLSNNGKISIRGKYLLNRATGVNRILGGSVQVN